jgi:hypothetical protein
MPGSPCNRKDKRAVCEPGSARPRRAIEQDGIGPVAESVDARAVHRSLSWFKSRPGLHASRVAQLEQSESVDGLRPGQRDRKRRKISGNFAVDGPLLGVSRLRNLV